MAKGLRIGFPTPGSRIITAAQGSYALSGQNATLTPSQASGISIVAGTLAINFSGLGSGTAPAWYDDYDSYTTGQTLVANGYSALNGAGSQANSVTVSTDWARQGTKSSKTVYPSQAGAALEVMEWFPEVGFAMPASSVRKYNSFWEKWTHTSGSDPMRLWKHIRAGTNPAYSGRPQYNVTRNGTDMSMSDAFTVNESSAELRPANYNNTELPGDQDNFVESFYDLSNPANTSNGKFMVYVNGVLQLTVTGITRVTGTNFIDYDFVQVGMDYYANNGYISYRDLFYSHNSYKRIVATNNATYASSTNWVLQKATTWTGDAFSGAFQQGNFSSGNTIHLHAFLDESNPMTATYLGSVVVP